MRTKLLLLAVTLIFFSNAFSQNWAANFEDAQKQAKEKNRNIVLVFSGSDWCAPCIKLDKTIWQSPEFIGFSKDHFVMLRADFPKSKKNKLSDQQQKENEQLAEKYNQQGLFPLVVLLDKQGKILGTTGYKNVTPKEYIDLLVSYENKKP